MEQAWSKRGAAWSCETQYAVNSWCQTHYDRPRYSIQVSTVSRMRGVVLPNTPLLYTFPNTVVDSFTDARAVLPNTPLLYTLPDTAFDSFEDARGRLAERTSFVHTSGYSCRQLQGWEGSSWAPPGRQVQGCEGSSRMRGGVSKAQGNRHVLALGVELARVGSHVDCRCTTPYDHYREVSSSADTSKQKAGTVDGQNIETPKAQLKMQHPPGPQKSMLRLVSWTGWGGSIILSIKTPAPETSCQH